MQFALGCRRLELGDFGGLRRLAVEGQHIAFRRERDMIAILQAIKAAGAIQADIEVM